MTYIFSNGDVADGSHVNDNFNKLNKLTNEKAINDVSATNSGVLAGSSQVIIDKFLDSNGQNNTVDTGTTTAEYRPGKLYACIGTSSISEPSFETVSSWTYSETDSDFTGARDSGWASKGTYSYKFTNGGGSIGKNTYAQILQSTDVTNWNSISLDYNITNISNPNEMTLQLIIGSTVIASVVLSVSSGTLSGDCSAINGTQNVIIKVLCTGAGGGSNNSMVCYVDNLTTQYTDAIVQSAVTTIPTGMTKVFVTPLLYEALATGDSITADVSIDNGAHYTTGVPINTWTPITSANGTQLIVKANLLTGSGVSTPKISGWRVLLE